MCINENRPLHNMAESEQVLNEILEKVAKEQGYDDFKITSKQISTDGANYTSFLYQASITAPNKEELKLFVKVAAAGEKMREIAPFRIFETESFAYNKLLKAYKEIEEKHDVPKEHRLVTPKFYANSDEYLREALVFEDLSASGYTMYDRFKSIDWEYTAKSVQNLAKFHALSIAWSIDDPEAFENTTPISMADNMDNIMGYLNTVVSNAILVTREENKERLRKFLDRVLDKNSYISLYRPINRAMIIHGDYRPSNLMHRFKEDGTLEVISLDYQTLQRGNPVLDLMYFIFSGSDKSFRDRYFDQTLDFYYEELCLALRRLNLDPELIYPRKDYDYEVLKVLPVGLTTGMFCLLIVTVDVEDAPKVNKDIAITDFAINPSNLYKTRLNEIIDFFIEKGVL
ncbi:uncharacterized protein LOC112044831 [Bicyclus anynana]|uniref:Uncharacterized protein LOC112044831 n=1 Tax=Bicyclus anynana TaxID=110368 RepID=A0A6J1MM26_BICAN|nr:uncharacterized protein LOC112044831 [Bicyclus anynana]